MGRSPLVSAFFFCALCIALLSVARESSAANPRYAITQLRQLSTAVGAYSVASGINDAGTAVGSDSIIPVGSPARYQNALTWQTNGQPTALTNPTNSPFARGLAINNTGVVAGQADSNTTSGQPTRAAVFTNGVGTVITSTPGSNFALATSVNDAGTVAGNDSVLPFLYANGTKTMLSTSSPSFSASSLAPVLISEAGVAYASGKINGAGLSRPYRLTPTTRDPLYADTTHAGFAFDVNRAGQVVGQIVTGTTDFGPSAAALFSNGVVTTLPGFGGTFATAYSINDRGVIVGGAGNAAFQSRAFRTISGVTIDLNTLLDANSGWTLIDAVSINNRGQIVGNGKFDDDHNSATPDIRAAFRLDPIRSPGDTNYDNLVNFDDLLTLAQNYGKSGNGTVFYETGDFNYDWAVNFDDLLALAQHYNQPATFAADWALAQQLVPEPTVLACLFTSLSLLGRRRAARV